MKSPIKNTLISINQSSSGYLVYFYYKLFHRVRKANIYAIKPRRLQSQILSFLYVCSFIFKENHIFNKVNNNSQQVVTVKEELDDIDVDEI